MTDLAQLVDTYYRSVNELANSLEQSLPVLTRGPSIQDLESISDYLNAVEKILSQVHQSIHDRLGIPVPAKSAQQTLLRGDLRFLIDAYYRNGTELVTSLRRDLPVLASGASIELLDKIDRSIYQAAQMISGLTRQVHEVLEANLLDREVLRYRFVLAMSEVASKGEDARTSYEAKNILERWLLNLANDKDPSAPDPIFSVGKLADNYPATEKMRAEFREKKIDPERRVPQILKLGREYLTVTQVPKTSKCRVDGRKISVAEFSFTYPEDRVQLLLSKAPASLICPMVVRYACLLPRGQQWATPSAVYEYLVTNYGVSVEGFASPLNSRIITLSQPGLGFCSLFPDTDAPFGSLGDFFQADFTGRSVMANPPFVPAVMDRMVQKIEDQINRGGSVRFFVVVPEWTDAQFYLDMMKSPHRLFDFQLPGNHYYYVDLEGNRISVKFNSHFFVLGTPDHRGDYSRLRDDLLRIYEQ
uniref:PCIF1 WW domain-containing protein n=1 Tax=viral metagenome TaxID=1070528 RepID=A0A6C0IXR1_9ZZZZ